jgi:hypothetical protein
MTRSRIRTATVALAAAGLIGTTAGTAQAYDRGTCNSIYGAQNVDVAAQFTIETGTTGNFDFGDDLHLFGEPRGTAVVCSTHDGRVRLIGKGFPDNGVTLVNPQVRVQFMGNNGVPAITLFRGLTVNVERTGTFASVRVTLFNAGQAIPGSTRTIPV